MADSNNTALSRSQRVLSNLAGNDSSAPNLLSKAEQLRLFRDRTQDQSWVDDVLPHATHPNAQFVLKTIKQHGIKGLADYHVAMTKLQKEMGGNVNA